MDNLLQLQYQSIQGARGALFTYLDTMADGDLFKPVAEFNDSNIASLLVHSANASLHWLVFFDEQQAVDFFANDDIKNMDDIRAMYQKVDEYAVAFLNRHQANYNRLISQHTRGGKALTTTPLQLFTHAITHEFHHKGQILTMSRMLGYIPADTDVIRT